MKLTTTRYLGLFTFNRSFDGHVKIVEKLSQAVQNVGRIVAAAAAVIKSRLLRDGFAKVMRQLIKHQLGGVHFGVNGRHAQTGVECKATQRGRLEQSHFVYGRHEPAGIVIDHGGDVQ